LDEKDLQELSTCLECNFSLLEREIQQLYQTHPYFIDGKFVGAQITPQSPQPSGFADLAIFQPDEITIVELKIDQLIPQYVLQLGSIVFF